MVKQLNYKPFGIKHSNNTTTSRNTSVTTMQMNSCVGKQEVEVIFNNSVFSNNYTVHTNGYMIQYGSI